MFQVSENRRGREVGERGNGVGGGGREEGRGATNRQSVPHMQCAYGNYLVHSCMVCIR